jgi:chromosome segregation ATPase
MESFMSDLEKRLSSSEAKRVEAEENQMTAAQFGKDLLEQVSHLEEELQEERQARHEANVKAGAANAAEEAAREELASLRLAVAETEDRVETNKALIKENRDGIRLFHIP